MLTIVYLLLGLAFMGGLFYALMQITARQRRLNAELTRLEQLAAEVALNAEAILDRVDERADRLNELLERAEARVTVAAAAAPVVETEAAPAEAAPAAEAPKKKRTRKPKAEQTSPPEPQEVATATPPTSIERYQKLRTAARALADQGKSPSDIAAELGVPRGEVLLLLNLRAKKVTA